MKPKKLKKLLASLSDVPLGCYRMVDNLAQAAEEIRELDQDRAAVKTELDAVVALQECAAHVGMNASVESIPFILDNLPRIVKDLVASSRWTTRAGGWEDCSGLDAELTISGPSGSNPRHFRRLRPECSPVIETLVSGEQAVTWGNGSDSYRVVTGTVKAVQKLSANGLWLLATEAEPEELSLVDRLEAVADRLGNGDVEAGYASGLLDDIAEELRAQKAVQS